MDKLIAEIKAYASAHYNDGWDFIVECYDDNDIREEIEEYGLNTFAKYKKHTQTIIEIREDRKPMAGWDY